jgi:hypothetical protein
MAGSRKHPAIVSSNIMVIEKKNDKAGSLVHGHFEHKNIEPAIRDYFFQVVHPGPWGQLLLEKH